MRIISLICALLWAALIYYLSDQPSVDIAPMFSHQDKLLHLAAYFVLGFFIMGALRKSPAGYRLPQIIGVTLLTALYGLLDEYHQSFVPGRNPALGDALADLAGGLLGALFMYLLARRAARRLRPSSYEGEL
ncbi:MAG: VanZ family protein [Halobacteria archaeon]|nr:VanZ family protein [Halobacteria archaeon]